MKYDDYDDGYGDYDDYSEEEEDADTSQYIWRGSSAATAPPAPSAAEKEAEMTALVASFREVLGHEVPRESINAALVASNNNPDEALASLQAQLAATQLSESRPAPASAPVLSPGSLSLFGRAVVEASEEDWETSAPPPETGRPQTGEAFVVAGKAVLPRTGGGGRVDAFDFGEPSPDDVILARRGRGQERAATARKKLTLPKPSAAKNGASSGAKNGISVPSSSNADAVAGDEPVPAEKPARLVAPSRKEKAPPPKKKKLKLHVPKRTVTRAHAKELDKERAEKEASTSKKASVQRTKQIDLAFASGSKLEHETSLSVVVAGHVDAGKSTLLGHLLSVTAGAVMMSNAKNEGRRKPKGKDAPGKARDLAWMTDEDAVERERGVTIDICTRVFETERSGKTRRFAMVDAPGHRDFVPAMILGTMQASAAVLVVDASTGEFEAGVSEEGQTREHAVLLRSMGVARLVVAVNKLDTVDYSKERYDEVLSLLEPILKRAGWRVRDVVFVPVAGRVGANLVERAPKGCPLAKWYKGRTFLRALEDLADKDAKAAVEGLAELREKPTRLLVADAFRSVSLGGVMAVSGRLLAGSVAPRDKLLLSPSGELATVKNVEVNGARTPVAIAGVDNTPVSIGLVDIVDTLLVSPGDVLCDPAAPAPIVTRFRAQILTIATPVPLLQGTAVEVHVGGGSEAGSLVGLVERKGSTAGESGTKKRPRRLVKGDCAVVDISVERAVCIERAVDVKALGRFSLRAHGRTVAAGIVMEILKSRTLGEGGDGEDENS